MLKPYRAALYSLLGLPSVAETVPTWSHKKQALAWQTTQVFADPIMKRALTNFVPASQEHLLKTFYGSKPELLTFRPPLAFTASSWDNHLWSLAAEALSLYFLVKEQTKDPRSFTDLLASISEDSGPSTPELAPYPSILFNCRECSLDDWASLFTVVTRDYEGKQLEMQC